MWLLPAFSCPHTGSASTPRMIRSRLKLPIRQMPGRPLPADVGAFADARAAASLSDTGPFSESGAIITSIRLSPLRQLVGRLTEQASSVVDAAVVAAGGEGVVAEDLEVGGEPFEDGREQDG